MAWICSKCGVETEDADDISISYGGMDLPDAEGVRCPKCGTEFLLSEFVIDQLSSAEDMLSGK